MTFKGQEMIYCAYVRVSTDTQDVARQENEIKKWLKHEIKHQQPIVDGKEILTDGTEGICEGRHECAKSLLNQIKNGRKNFMEMIELLSLIYKLRDDIERQKGIHYDHMRQLDKMIDIVKPLADHENKLQDPNL